MKNKNMFLIILVSLFVLTSIMSVSVKGEFNCHIKDTLLQGESKTYTVNHLDHYIQPTIITNTYPYHVKFNVNGKLTDILKVGDTFTLVDGAKINVIEILQSEAGDETGSLVQFCFDGDVTNYDTVCTDSDGGKNYYVKGKTEGKAGYKEGIVSETDSCFNCNNLAVKSYSCDAGSDCCVSEGYCLNNEVFIGSLQCPNGCKDGACIKDIAFSCDIKDTLAEGKSKTYTIHGIDYDVKPIVITNIHPYKVKFVVNDELTYLLGIGGAFTLSNGARIAVIEILPNEAGDITSDLVNIFGT